MSKNKLQTLPLTPDQQSILIQHCKYPDFPVANVISRVIFRGQLHVPVLEKAFSLTAGLFDIFSMQFTLDGKKKTRLLLSETELVPLVCVNCQSETAIAISPEDYPHWFTRFTQDPISYMNQPLYRLALVQKQEQVFELWLVFSHAICDGWGKSVFLTALYAVYDALLAGNEQQVLSSLRKTLPRFATATEKAEQYLQSQQYLSDKAHWKEQLTQLPAQTISPRYQFDFAEQEFIGSRRITSYIQNEQFSRIAEFVKQQGISFNQYMQAIICLYLSNVYRVNDVLAGQVFHNRRDKEAKYTVGLFSKIVANRVRFQREFTLAELLTCIKQRNETDKQHGAFPLEHLSGEVDIYQSGRSQFFDVVFNYLKIDLTSHPKDVATESSYISIGHDPYPLNLSLVEFGQQQDVELNLEHNYLYFNDKEGDLALERFRKLFLSLPDLLDEKVHAIDVTCDSDWALVREYNQTEHPFETGKTMPQLFAHRALQQPGAIALHDVHGDMPYGELLQATMALAQKLEQIPSLASALQHSEQPQAQPVGIYLDKGRMQLVAALAIMSRGHFYVPLETHWPAERIAKVIEKAAIQTVITSEHLHASLPSYATTIAVAPNGSDVLVSPLDVVQQQNWVEALAQHTLPSDLAYVIFTSGSTGEPKGVAITHQAVINTLHDINARLAIGSDDSVLAVSDLAFDLNVYDFFGMLAAGGTIIFTHPGQERDPAHWGALVEQHNVTLWDTVPASADLLVSWYELNQQPSRAGLRHIMLSGDWLPPTLPHRLEQVFTGSGKPVQVHSFGGATEASIWSITYPILNDTRTWKSIPYGKPLSNQSFYVLNAEQNIQVVGVEGELHIGGAGVAECYFNDEQKTRQSYFYHQQLQQRLYKTGDLGRLMTNGNIQFIGRADNQVKINGFRVELGEIESHLKQMPQVAEVVCDVAENPSGGGTLNAFIVPEADQDDFNLLTALCKQHLGLRVPAYMQPSNYVSQSALPLTANGKVDRKALPAIDVQQTEYQPPVTETETYLAALWTQELAVQQPSINSSFFQLGGTSVHAIRLLMQINSRYPTLELKIRDVMQKLSIAALAEFIDEQQALSQQHQEDANELEQLEW